MRLNALGFKQVHSGVPMGSTRVQSELKSIPFGPLFAFRSYWQVHAGRHTHSQKPAPPSHPPSPKTSIDVICPFPNWGFFFQRSDYVCMCFEASSLCEASRFSPPPTPEGTKEAPVPPLGARGGRLTPINPPSPSHFLPGVLGLC